MATVFESETGADFGLFYFYIMTDGGNGWIKLHRKLIEKGYYKKSQYVHLWIHLLISANHRKKEFMWNKQIIIIKEGQMITGRKQLSKATGITQGTIENILETLENEHQILQQKTNRYRLITIVNWNTYQKIDSTSDNKVTTESQQSDTNKNDKNDKKLIPESKDCGIAAITEETKGTKYLAKLFMEVMPEFRSNPYAMIGKWLKQRCGESEYPLGRLIQVFEKLKATEVKVKATPYINTCVMNDINRWRMETQDVKYGI